MSGAPSRYPLAWPAHRPRTPSHRRKSGRFTKDGRGVNAADAMMRVEAELDRLGGRYPLLSSNVELRVDGRPRSDRSAPSDPGVCLYFDLRSKPFALACDTYDTVAQNIAALAAHLEATRAIERHGVASAAESLQAFSALPPPSVAVTPASRAWWLVLGMASDPRAAGLPAAALKGAIDAAYREAARKAHPDNGGSTAIMAALNAARDQALKEISQ